MTIVAGMIAARKAMQRLVADETAKIASSKGQYSFKYVSLENLIDTITPPLLEAGVLMVQDVGSLKDIPSQVYVNTRLYGDDDGSVLETGPLYLSTDGTAKAVAGAITSLRRLQLMAMLGLAASDDEPAPQPQRQVDPNPRLGPAPRPAPNVSLPKGDDKSWEEQAPLRKAAEKARTIDVDKMSDKLHAMMMKIRAAEMASGTTNMPTVPDEGKKMSMYHFLTSKVPMPVLCFLYARVISEEVPPKLGTRFLVDEIAQGQHGDIVEEVKQLLR